jgi:hypothetical protein
LRVFAVVKGLLTPQGNLFLVHSWFQRGGLRIHCSSHLSLGLTHNCEHTDHLTSLLCVLIFFLLIFGLHSLRLIKDYTNKNCINYNEAERYIEVNVTNLKHDEQKIQHG